MNWRRINSVFSFLRTAVTADVIQAGPWRVWPESPASKSRGVLSVIGQPTFASVNNSVNYNALIIKFLTEG